MTPEEIDRLMSLATTFNAGGQYTPNVHRLVGELLNALDSLRARLGEAERENKTIRESWKSMSAALDNAKCAVGAMREYGKHRLSCKLARDAQGRVETKCDCGWAALLRSDIGAREAAWKRKAKEAIEGEYDRHTQYERDLIDALLADRIAADGSVESEVKP